MLSVTLTALLSNVDIFFQGSLTSAAVPHKEEAVLFVYTAPEHDLCGPTGPTDQQLQKLG